MEVKGERSTIATDAADAGNQTFRVVRSLSTVLTCVLSVDCR